MKRSFRALLKDIAPPLVVQTYRQMRGQAQRFHGDFPDWKAAAAETSGYDGEEIFEKTRAAAMKVRNSEAVFERDSVLFDKVQYEFQILAPLLKAACAQQGRLNVLDFGGSLGTTYRQFKAFCPAMETLKWAVVDQRHIVQCGKDLFRNTELDFFHSIEEAVRESRPDVIVLSSVLQYLESPYKTLGELISLRAKSIVIDKTPMSDFGRDVLAIQTVPASIYKASYPCWIFSREKLSSAFSESYSMIADMRSKAATSRSKRGEFGFDSLIFEIRDL